MGNANKPKYKREREGGERTERQRAKEGELGVKWSQGGGESMANQCGHPSPWDS